MLQCCSVPWKELKAYLVRQKEGPNLKRPEIMVQLPAIGRHGNGVALIAQNFKSVGMCHKCQMHWPWNLS